MEMEMETSSSKVTEQKSSVITELTQSVKKVLDSENDSENDSEDDDYSYEDKEWGDEYLDNGDEFSDHDDSNRDDSNRDDNYRIRPKFFNKINMKIKKK